MAIKIDLLPAHVGLRKRLKFAIAASAVSLALAASALVLVLDAKQKELQTAQTDRDIYVAIAAKTTDAETQQKKFVSDAQPVTDTIGFLLAASKTGAQRAALISQISKYIYDNTVVTGIDVSDGQNVKISGSVRNPDEYAVFLLTLRRASDANGGPLFAGLPRAGGVKGFNNGAVEFVLPPTPADQPVVIVYPLNVAAEGKLKYPVALPPDPVPAKTTTGTAGAPGAPGGPTPGAAGGTK